MNAPQPPASFRPQKQISADRGALLTTLVRLWPYIWPSDRADLKMRVVWATVLLLAAKLATVAVPDRKSTRLNSSHKTVSRMPSSA